MSDKETTVNDWLMDAKALKPGDQLNIYLGRHVGASPTFPDMRAALYTQFGKDTPIRIFKHGQRICIFIHSNDADRLSFDKCNTSHERTDIENEFHN